MKKRVMKVKDYYRLLIRKKSREPIVVIYFWNSFLYLDSDFVWKAVFLLKLKQMRNNEVRQINFEMIQRFIE